MELMRLETRHKNKNKSKIRSEITWLIFIVLLLSIAIYFLLPYTAADQTTRARQNNAPTAEIVKPENGDRYEPLEVVHFDASNSSDPDNDALYYSWDFGDGTTGSGMITSHAYQQPWVPIVTLEVSDGELNDTDRVVIIIGTGGGMNQPPNANISEPNNGDTFSAQEEITFDGSLSSDPDEDQITYEWDFGDGNKSKLMIAKHAYSSVGVYRVRLNVSDGMFNDSARVFLIINNTPPIADAGEDQEGYPGEVLYFDGSNSEDPDIWGRIVNYTWDLGDNNIKFGVNVSHKYRAYGLFTVTLTVTDNNDDTDTDEVDVLISNEQPVAMLRIISQDTVVNTDIEIDASQSYDLDGSVDEYYYDFGDGDETDWVEDSVVDHRYSLIGRYTITLVVKDNLKMESEPVYLDVDITKKINQPPTVAITYPSKDESVAGKIVIRGTATDPESYIENVYVKIDDEEWEEAFTGSIKGDSLNWEHSWDTEEVSDGEHTITARAWDGNKNSDEQTVKVFVNNRPTTYIDITEKLTPSKCAPGESVVVSGEAKYDTGVAVSNAEVEIKIIETQKVWSTPTTDQGKYSYIITAPTKAGKYSVQVSINDGTLERENSKELTVLTPPDLYVMEADIKFSKRIPKEFDIINITITVHNSGGIKGTGTVSFYLDDIMLSARFESKSVTVPENGAVKVTSAWPAKVGDHEIIIEVTDVEPLETNQNNNRASKNITVAGVGEEAEDKAQESWVDQLVNMPPIYKFSIIGIIVFIIIIVTIAAAFKVRKAKGTKPESAQGTGDLTKTDQAGMVVFKPLDKDLPTQKPKRSNVAIVVTIFAIMSIIMMGIAFIMPWYTITMELGDFSFEESMSLSEVRMTDTQNDISISASWDSDELEIFAAQRNVYNTTQYLVIASLIMSILLLIGAIVAIVKKGKKVAVFFGFLAFIFCLVTPILFMTWHPGAYAEDYEIDANEEEGDGPYNKFMGSLEQEIQGAKVKAVWGPSLGWYLAVMGFIFALLGFIAALMIPKSKPAIDLRKAPAPAQKPMKIKFEEVPSSSDVLFKPIDDDEIGITETQTGRLEKQQVKFESVGFR